MAGTTCLVTAAYSVRNESLAVKPHGGELHCAGRPVAAAPRCAPELPAGFATSLSQKAQQQLKERMQALLHPSNACRSAACWVGAGHARVLCGGGGRPRRAAGSWLCACGGRRPLIPAPTLCMHVSFVCGEQGLRPWELLGQGPAMLRSEANTCNPDRRWPSLQAFLSPIPCLARSHRPLCRPVLSLVSPPASWWGAGPWAQSGPAGRPR